MKVAKYFGKDKNKKKKRSEKTENKEIIFFFFNVRTEVGKLFYKIE